MGSVTDLAALRWLSQKPKRTEPEPMPLPLPLNPNWHETGRIYLLIIFELDFVS